MAITNRLMMIMKQDEIKIHHPIYHKQIPTIQLKQKNNDI
jgi:hypothetical protein